MEEAEIELFIDEIGKRIHQLRKEKNMTQLDLAVKSNIDVRQIQRLERGHTAATIKTICKLTIGLNVDFLSFFEFMKEK